jgi:hypothetical protein
MDFNDQRQDDKNPGQLDKILNSKSSRNISFAEAEKQW